MKVLVHWEDKYADTPTFSVRYFISDIERIIGKKIETKKVLVDLVSSLNKPESELLPDPEAALRRFKLSQDGAHSISQHQYRIPEAEAFELLIGKWLSLVSTNQYEKIKIFVSKSIRGADIQQDFEMLLNRWLNSDEDLTCPSYVEAEDLRLLTNFFYQGFCDVLGPVKADELLNESVARLQTNGGAMYRDVFVKLL